MEISLLDYIIVILFCVLMGLRKYVLESLDLKIKNIPLNKSRGRLMLFYFILLIMFMVVGIGLTLFGVIQLFIKSPITGGNFKLYIFISCVRFAVLFSGIKLLIDPYLAKLK